jgi:hypothetical protein
MHYVIALVATLLVLWLSWPDTQVPIKAVAVEGIRAQRMSDTSFARRFYFVPEGGDAIAESNHKRVETMPAASPAPPARTYRRVSLRRDVCARHGMRKVMVGKYRWRCRR